MDTLNSRIQQIKPSATLAVKAKATELKRQGREVIDLSCGEPDIDTPEHIKEAMCDALRKGKTKYTDVAGILELRSALSNKFKNENQIDADPSSVVITNGGKQALYELFDVILNEGDEVIVPAPYWVSYPPMIEMCRGNSVIVRCGIDTDYKITPEALERALAPTTKAIILNSPSNPTGMGYSAEELKALGEVLKRHHALIISDEVYEKVVFKGYKFTSFAAANPDLAERTITINAFSKSFSMTGWRVGYATGPKAIIQSMAKHQSQTTSNINTPAQYAAIAALEGPTEFLKEAVENFERRTDVALHLVKDAKGIDVPKRPDGAFYLFLRLDELKEKGLISGSTEFATQLMEKAGVAVVPGIEFGDDGAVRISTAASDETVKNGVQKICEFAESLGR